MIIDFNNKFYNLRAIEKSIKAYDGLAMFSVEKNKKDIKVKITNIGRDFEKETFKNEFCNYVLSEIKNN